MSVFIAGQWNAICDVCGFEFKNVELKKNWRGLMVCSKDFETRHPQSLLKHHTETTSVPWARPEPTDLELVACYLWGESAYAGLGSAGCMKAGYTPLFYEQLLELKGP